MNVRVLLPIFAVCVVALLLYSLYLLAFPWNDLKIADYMVRTNRITGKVEILREGRWTHPEDDPYADSIPATTLPYIGLSGVTWGPKGLLCFRMENRTTETVKGRLALRLVQKEIKRQVRLNIGGDRTLRVNVVLPPRTPVPFVLDTNLSTPDTTKVQTILTIQPTAYSGQ